MPAGDTSALCPLVLKPSSAQVTGVSSPTGASVLTVTCGAWQAGGPLRCMAAARLYGEVSVCQTCYQFYTRKTAQWQRHPKVLLSVASVPALGLIGQKVESLPEEIRKELDTLALAPPKPVKRGTKKRAPLLTGRMLLNDASHAIGVIDAIGERKDAPPATPETRNSATDSNAQSAVDGESPSKEALHRSTMGGRASQPASQVSLSLLLSACARAPSASPHPP